MRLRGGTSAGHERESGLSQHRKHLDWSVDSSKDLGGEIQTRSPFMKDYRRIVVTTPDILKFALFLTLCFLISLAIIDWLLAFFGPA
jgi:hypothetical protein